MIAQDKLAHFLAGIALAALAYPLGVAAAAALCVACGIGKELWDARGRGTPEVADSVATMLGGGLLLGWYQVLQTMQVI